MTSSHKVVEYAPIMDNNPQNPVTKSPEKILGSPAKPVGSSPIATSGEIIFKKPVPTIENPRQVIEEGKITPIEVYRQRADEALLKKAA